MLTPVVHICVNVIKIYRTCTSFIKINLSIPSTLHSTCTSAYLAFGIGLRTGLCSVQIMHHIKQIQYVEPKEDHMFLASVSP